MYLFCGKDGDLTGQHKESQGVSMLALHLLDMNRRLDLELTAQAATTPGPRTSQNQTAVAPA